MIGWNITTSWLKKQYFNSLHMLDIASNAISPKCEHLYLFGIQFKITDPEEKKTALALYQSIIWFTYRENVKFFRQSLDGSVKQIPDITNDIGWGCMMRVGQMMFAQALRVHAGKDKYSDEQFLNKLIQQFVINEKGRFTIQEICNVGSNRMKKKVGDWYTPADIAYSLETLAEENAEKTNHLKVMVLNGEFQLNGLLKKVWKKGDLVVQPVLLIFLVRLGYQYPEVGLLKSVIQILQTQPSCLGILGGRPGKAHYIVGTTNDSFIYLDPHCVKDQSNIQSFFPPSLFTLKHQKIDPSMGICFYLHTLKDFLNLHSFLQEMKDPPIYAFCQKKQKEDFYECDAQQEEIYEILRPDPEI